MTTEIVETLDAVAGAYDAVLCDLWGCYHNGITPYPAAVAALRRYRARGGIVVLLTNAPRPAPQVRRFLDRIGAPEDSWDGIMSSGEACQRALRQMPETTRFHYVGPDRDLHMLADIGHVSVPAERADAILCTGLFDDATEGPDDYRDRAADWRGRNLPLLCANPDVIVDRGEERLWCAGAIAQLYEDMDGPVTWFGKPHAPTYDQSFALLAELAGRDVPKERVLAIGDGINTDVRGGVHYGLDVLFTSGGLAAAEVGDDPEHPDPARLAAYLDGHGLVPRYTIGRLR